MNTNPDEPAYPQTPFIAPNGDVNIGQAYFAEAGGLTKREHFAALAMQGLIASIGSHDVIAPDEIASDAINYADALLAALNQPRP